MSDGLSAQSMKANMIKEHDRIVLKNDIPAQGLKAGDVGTAVHVYRDGLAYEVEFTMLAGDTAAVVTVEAPQVRAVHCREIIIGVSKFRKGAPLEADLVPA
ncbi:MAG: DUF4926 domain-containing protein [Limisphaerales bacterium]